MPEAWRIGHSTQHTRKRNLKRLPDTGGQQEQFYHSPNIERYRHLLKTTKDEIERRMILKLLTEKEMAQLQQGAQNEDRFRELPAIPKEMTARSVSPRK